MPRFVILEHDHPVLHWDFMLEAGNSLRTWRLSQMPCVPSCMDCQALPDHRLAYLDYEGPVSKGRGSVQRTASGQYALLRESDRELVVELRGAKLSAVVSLRPPRGCGIAEFSTGAATGSN
jgi:hypothetical protein